MVLSPEGALDKSEGSVKGKPILAVF